MPVELGSMKVPMTRYEYVLGFIFSIDKHSTALLLKERPHWQKGLLNGFGGGIEKDELPLDAMHREGKEETGFEFLWEYAGIVTGKTWKLHVFRAFTPDLYALPMRDQDHGDEQIIITTTKYFMEYPHVSNIRYLLPMALDVNVQFEITDSWEAPKL